MKNFKVKWLLLSIILSVASINTAWAWTDFQLVSDFYGSYGRNTQNFTYGDIANRYWDVYHNGSDHYWRLYETYFNHDAGPNSSNYVLNVGTTGYKVVNTSTNSFKTTGSAGIIRIQTSQNRDGASDEFPNVWVTRPTVSFKYPWDGTNWELVDATDNYNGTYTYRGTYRGTNFFNAGPNDADKVAKTSTTVYGSPSSGDRCEFKWTGSGYKYTGGEEDNRGVFTITKLVKITYDANGATKGSVPYSDGQEILYNTSSTLATNSGKLEKVGYKFKGWYTTSTGTGGTHYDAGGSITRTSNITLYAEWEAADDWRIKGSKTAGSGTDYLGNWAKQNHFTYSSEHALVWSVSLGASQTYEFGIVKTSSGSETWYGNTGTIEATTTAEWVSDANWTFESDKGNCKLKTGTAGTYVFTIDATAGNPRLRVYFPGDAPKVFLPKNKIIYLDGATNSVWQAGNYNADFWFKATTEDVHTSAIECLYDNDLDVNYMYYTKVPDNDYVDRVQINRMNPSGGAWNYSQVKHGYTRTNAKQNCLVLPASGDWGDGSSNWASLSWGTYCPPMSSATLAHNDGEHTTTIYDGDGSNDHPYLVATSSSIYVSATSESTLDDENMTAYYQFKQAGSNDGSESSTATHTYTASSTNGTKQAMTVVARNYYNSTYGTASSASNAIYYQAGSPYSVTPSLTHMTVASGRTGSAAIVHGATYVATLDSTEGYYRPTSVTVTRGGTDISASCTWNKSTGVLTIPGAQVTGNITITAVGVAKTYTASNNLNVGDGGTAGTYTATYDATTIAIGTTPTRTGYVVEGYYKSYSDGTYTEKIADASGNLQSNTSYTTSNKWTNDGNVTLYTKWTPVELTFKSDASTTAWGTASNWNPACVPTIEHDVVLQKSAVVTGGTTAAAKSVKIDGSSSAVKLTIESTGALIVAQDIKAKHEDEDSYGATNENDLRIESNSSGNGTLIVGNASTNTMASYQAYSKSWYVSNYGFINQYIGIPFDELYAYQYYGRLLYEYDDARDAWKASSTTMEAFKAYNILSKADSYDYFYLDGTLNLPGKDGDGRLQTLTCGSRIGDGTNAIGDYMFANSWTAPIYITAMTAEDFDGVAQAIYIFNAGSDKGSTDKPDGLGNNPGQWTTITLADIGSLEVIPSTQAFLVKNTKSGGTLKLDYNKHVFAPAKAAVDAGGVISTEPIRAPKHEQTNDNPSTRLNIIVRSDSIYSDYVRIHERADFTNDYDDGWEAAKIFGIAAAPQLYAISDIGRMAVNAVPEIEGMVIGFTKGSVDDTYTMSFEYDGEEALYLNDLKEQTSTLIAADNSYQFTSAANDTEARFVISCTPIAHTPTGVSDINNQQSAARKLMIDGKLYIIRDGGMYDTTGAMVK